MITNQRKHVDNDDDFDENGCLRDGRRFRTPLFMLDSVQREIVAAGLGVHINVRNGTVTRVHDGMGRPAGSRPGFVFGDNGDRGAAFEAYDARSRWLEAAYLQRPPADAADAPAPITRPAPSTNLSDAQRRAQQAYDARNAALESAWRTK